MTETDATTAFDAAERAMWAGRTEAYARSFGRLCTHTVPALLDAAGIAAGTRVLDVGTGTGTAALAAAERGALVRAVDADAGMVAEARRRGVAAEVAVLPELPFPDGEFDAVIGNFVLNHVGRPRTALAELRRVLRPGGTSHAFGSGGGRIAVTLWGARHGGGQELLGAACAAGGAVPPSYLPRLAPDEDFERTPQGLAGLLTEAGFGGAGAEELEWDHRATVEEWWGGVAGGVGNVGLVVTSQDAETTGRIRREYERLCARYDDGEGLLALPHVALLASGTA